VSSFASLHELASLHRELSDDAALEHMKAQSGVARIGGVARRMRSLEGRLQWRQDPQFKWCANADAAQ
jgi:hypothetical protein